ncbi:MAG: YjjG family noncanonical pyrimidine nucleotidase [Tenuifilaceae bacterium]|jgi:putative hydrolase of the HAD superfamily|uniref:YjjG family noncanonical pyrimidine nucleotidase n=1 Tax=Perlabentimonas gracilis TaxID=2715279 RepID=UPI00140CA6B4|nr:YjjG family noncanonical pyrimidine nucleotidase [Perlabentimonas gracilis]MDX9770547.1 YjjG family noncanonical pyrimidine nucleotidase [Tenuifilaceae bacterium]NHB67388.1 noncanonical pyrimidine nucleotidase, YjjG family [Perlabentimonas gracilis]
MKQTYKHIFWDLDRTLWDFEQNMRITLKDIFENHNLKKAIPSPDHFIDTFVEHNNKLWASYQRGAMKKEVLRFKRFEVTLKDYGIRDKVLAEVIGDEYINESPKKTALIPHSIEILDYLHSKYKLHIITNGFNEVQFTKLKLCGIEKYFDKVVTSEISGYHKPRSEAFGYTLASANAKKQESIMIGDDIEADIIGAQRFGINQVYFNPSGTPHNEKPTHEIDNLLDLKKIL